MKQVLKIAIIGDFNFTYNAHHATNIAIEHASVLLKKPTNYYWIRLHEAVNSKVSDLRKFDGIWIAPGPYENEFFLPEIIQNILALHKPFLITGRGYKTLLEELIKIYNLNTSGGKAISENLFEGEQYDRIEVHPTGKTLTKLYKNKSRFELSTSRFAIYPQMHNDFLEVIDIEAINQFDEPEIISLKARDFGVATMCLPQITSTRESPHPLIVAFLNYMKNL